ncbi:UNVERIFIED_CONTAM: Retrovirus-related Pol polyprotein from transposon RE1 [Sesamum indicum]
MAELNQNDRIAAEQLEREALYIHPSENSSLTLSSSPLDGTNFLTWSRAVYVALGTKMKLGFIDGTFPKPAIGSRNFEQWRRVDLTVTSWLWNSISKDIVESFMYVTSSRELWLELQGRYGRSNGPMIYQIQREISSISQLDLSLTAYITKLKKYWNELLVLAPPPRCTCGCCTCGVNKAIEERNDHMQLMQFLMGLHEVFDSERSQVLMQDPLPTMERVFSMLFTVEKQRQIHTETGATPQHMAYQLITKDGRRNGGDRFQNKRRPYVDKRNLICTHCNRTGHAVDTCFQIHGVPEWYKTLGDKNGDKKKKVMSGKTFAAAAMDEKSTSVDISNTKQLTEMMADLISLMQKKNTVGDPISNYSNFTCHDDVEFAGNTSDPSGIDLDYWIIDTGATNHICSNLRLFHSFTTPTQPIHIYLPDGTSKPAMYVGLIRLNKLVTLTNVLYLPSFSVNLLSVSQLCRDTSYIFHFTDSKCLLQDQANKDTLFEGNRFKNLYTVRQIPCGIPSNSMICNSSSNSAESHCNTQVWHHRLGHIPLPVMKHLQLPNFSVPVSFDPCDICHRAKQARTSFHLSESHSEENGIVHHTSCTYTPQQNGRIERKHRQLLDVARALLFQASLPLKFWGDSILTATYLINRTPSKILQWKTPFENANCLCYTTNIEPHRTKFDSRSFKCILLGYPMTQKGYKLFDMDNNRVIVSRDVRFYEQVFPYSVPVSHSPQSCPLPIVSSSADDSVSYPETVSASCPASTPTSVPPSETIFPNTEPLPRRSTRVSQRPIWLNDFVCTAQHPSSLLTHTSAYKSFVASLSILQEPKSFSEAVQHKEWREAMNAELQALDANHTWKVVPLPPGKRAIGCKWVFKTKLRADGSVERYKARLVAKGFNQIAGIDYTDSFSPVAKSVTVRIFLAIAAAYTWPIQQLDINNAFLHGYLEEDIFMSPPEGYDVPPNLVCKLQRSLYGLKQASRQWNAEFTLKLTAYGFAQSVHDHCLFVKPSSSGLMALLVYVDDILITGPSLDDISRVKQYLHSLFTIKDMGNARYFLGLEIARSTSGLYVAQTKYAMDIITDTGLAQAKPASSPFPPGLKLDASSGPVFSRPDSYRRLVGRLLYLGFTRPDISYSVQQLSQYLNQPHDSHWRAALHVVRYLKGCPSKGLYFPASNSLVLRAFCDADWASCPDSRRSLTGYCVFLGDALVSWKTKKQSTVSRSTAESEYRSLASTVCELRWISFILSDFNISTSLPIELFCDNKAALHILANPVFHERTKHIELDCHLVRNAYKDGFIAPSFVPGVLQLADVFTKALPLKTFTSSWAWCPLVPVPLQQLEQQQQSEEEAEEDAANIDILDAG